MTYDQAIAIAQAKQADYRAEYKKLRNSATDERETMAPHLEAMRLDAEQAYAAAQKIRDEYEAARWADGDSL